MKITIEGTEEEIRRALERIAAPKEIVEPARIPAPFRVDPLPSAPVWISPQGFRDIQVVEIRVGDAIPDPFTVTCLSGPFAAGPQTLIDDELQKQKSVAKAEVGCKTAREIAFADASVS